MTLPARVLWSIGVCALAASAPARGQEPSTSDRAVFRSDTAMVVLDIVVRDRRGRPVRDLRAGEVQVFEDGQLRPVESFRLVEGTDPSSVPDTTRVESLQPDPLRRITLVSLVFDHLSQNGRQLATQAALQFLDKDLPEGTWVAVFVVDRRVLRLQNFTREREQLRAAVARAGMLSTSMEAPAEPAGSRERYTFNPNLETPSGESGPGAPPAAPGAGSALGGSFAERAIYELTRRMETLDESGELQQRGQSTLFPLMTLARAQGALEGRKAILFFSEGFQVPVNLEEAFRATISEANRANVSFYAVDARGLDTARALEGAAASLNRAGRTSQQEMLKRGAGPVTIDEVMNAETALSALGADTQSKLQELAISTGGLLIANSNDLRRKMDRVSADLASYYEIAYAPLQTELDGRFRRVEIKVARRGVTVQARSGYFALPATDGAPLLPYELPLLAALTEASPPHPFAYRAGVFRFHQTALGRQHTLLVEVPLEHLTFEEDSKAKQYRLRFAVMALVRDGEGRIVERMSNAYPLEGPLERLDALKRGSVVFKRQVWLAPGAYRLAIAAHDQAAGRASVQHLDVEVPPVAGGVRISTPAIIRRVDQAGDAPDPVEDPFRAGPMRIVPSLDTPISKAANAQISAFIVLYPAGAEVKPELTIEFVRDGAIVGRGVPPLSDPDEQGRISCVATFPADFAPGTYELRAVAKQGDTSDEAKTTFTVVP